MCRRYSLKHKDKNLFQAVNGFEEIFSNEEVVVPGEKGAVLVKENGTWKLQMMTFGFFVHGKYIYNARSESILEKPLFKDSYALRKCIIPCSFFYEDDKFNQEHSFLDHQGNLLYLAGIYDDNHFVILTQKPNEEVSFYHPRMPLAIRKEEILRYLNSQTDIEILKDIKKPDLVSPDSSIQISLF